MSAYVKPFSRSWKARRLIPRSDFSIVAIYCSICATTSDLARYRGRGLAPLDCWLGRAPFGGCQRAPGNDDLAELGRTSLGIGRVGKAHEPCARTGALQVRELSGNPCSAIEHHGRLFLADLHKRCEVAVVAKGQR